METNLHRKAECAAEIPNEEQLHQIVYSTVDPPTPLTEKNSERIRNNGLADRLRNKNLFSTRESLQHQSRQIAILSEQQQILLVQSIDFIILIPRDDIRIGKDRHEIPLRSLWRFDAYHQIDRKGKHTIHTETPGQTSNTTEYRLERLRKVMRDIILKDLYHRHPTILLIRNLRFPTKSHNLIIFHHCRSHIRNRIRKNLRIRINL